MFKKKNSSMVSIIIPCEEIDDYTKECIEHCKRLDYDNYEIILLPDNYVGEIKKNSELKLKLKLKIVPTGHATPGRKRNIGIKKSKGEFCAFIDSDAYPRKDWLRKAMKYFEDQNVVVVGGPGITPDEDSPMQKASGYIFSSVMVGGLANRFKAGEIHESDDVHSCNFIARKCIFKDLKWDEKYWPGEDTLLCLDVKKSGKKMIEASDVIIYHHRRPLFFPHLKQVSRFGLHRGFFAKKFPENSLKFVYFLPSFLLLFLIFGGIISYFFQSFRLIFITVVLVYLILSLITALSFNNIKLLFPVWGGIILTHLTYGMFFLIGLIKKELKR